MKKVVLVPVKDPQTAKLRLAPILTPEERSLLAWAMFQDIDTALRSASSRCDIAIVTNSIPAATMARSHGWRVFWETNQISESASVDFASVQLDLDGVEAVLRLPADIPLVRAGDVEELLEAPIESPGAILIPSRDHMGTNALLRSPPNVFASRFGHNSLVLHIQEAMRAQAAFAIIENPRIALDLDNTSDILRFLELNSQTETCRLLDKLGVGERLLPHAT